MLNKPKLQQVRQRHFENRSCLVGQRLPIRALPKNDGIFRKCSRDLKIALQRDGWRWTPVLSAPRLFNRWGFPNTYLDQSFRIRKGRLSCSGLDLPRHFLTLRPNRRDRLLARMSSPSNTRLFISYAWKDDQPFVE